MRYLITFTGAFLVLSLILALMVLFAELMNSHYYFWAAIVALSIGSAIITLLALQ